MGVVRGLIAVVLVGMVLTLAGPASAQKRMEDAKREFLAGRAAYDKSDYAGAYDHFKRSFVLSQEPALLYNISSALQGLGRPGEAAESLRDYLKIIPNDPERTQIEQRIGTLTETQKLLDREAVAKAKEAEARDRAVVPATVNEKRRLAEETARFEKMREEEQIRLAALQRASMDEELRLNLQSRRLRESEQRLDSQRLQLTSSQAELRERDKKRRRGLAIGLSIAGLVVVGTAVGLGLGLRQTTITHTPADIGPVTATP